MKQFIRPGSKVLEEPKEVEEIVVLETQSVVGLLSQLSLKKV